MEKSLKQKPSDCIKVVMFGPESTGKTTLAMKLAEHYNTAWVPEYARDYLQKKWDKEKKICETTDLLPIAKGQIKIENELTEIANKILICDTDLLETKVYSETYYGGSCDPLLEEYAIKNQYDLYFLTYVDIPWVKDDLRDKPFQRAEMFAAFEQALIEYNRPYIILKGSMEQRLTIAVETIDKKFFK